MAQGNIAPMLTVWGRRSSLNVQKVMWAIGELGLSRTPHRREADPFGGLDTAEFRAMNPTPGACRCWPTAMR